MSESCQFCRFSRTGTATMNGQPTREVTLCCRFPATAHFVSFHEKQSFGQIVLKTEPRTLWPEVKPTDWCGEFALAIAQTQEIAA